MFYRTLHFRLLCGGKTQDNVENVRSLILEATEGSYFKRSLLELTLTLKRV